jgi:hypothetical protein
MTSSVITFTFKNTDSRWECQCMIGIVFSHSTVSRVGIISTFVCSTSIVTSSNRSISFTNWFTSTRIYSLMISYTFTISTVISSLFISATRVFTWITRRYVYFFLWRSTFTSIIRISCQMSSTFIYTCFSNISIRLFLTWRTNTWIISIWIKW